MITYQGSGWDEAEEVEVGWFGAVATQVAVYQGTYYKGHWLREEHAVCNPGGL